MTSLTVDRERRASTGGIARIHLLLILQTFIIILYFAARLGSLTEGFVFVDQSLRWADLIHVLALPLLSVISYTLLKKAIQQQAEHRALNAAFLAGLILLAGSYTISGLSRSLSGSSCTSGPSGGFICSLIAGNFESATYVFFLAGFLLINATLMILQVLNPYQGKLSALDKTLLIANGCFIGFLIFANLLLKASGVELILITMLALLALELTRQRRSLPLALYYATAYWLGLFGVAIAKLY